MNSRYHTHYNEKRIYRRYPGRISGAPLPFASALVASVEVEQVLFVLAADQSRYMFSLGQACAFSLPVAGVVTKVGLATAQQCARARELLALAGADPIFEVSAKKGTGMRELLRFLDAERME
ncbi:EutP/PduV family microcompartment system protein [Bacillota bacterium Meth-B3]